MSKVPFGSAECIFNEASLLQADLPTNFVADSNCSVQDDTEVYVIVDGIL